MQAYKTSGTMLRTTRMLIVSVALYAVWVVPGSAFQLFGSDDSLPSDPRTSPGKSVDHGSLQSVESRLELGDGGAVDNSSDETMNIWIPGLGVVGKMPKLDFGLEMLYGDPETPKESPHTAQELEEFNSDFAIKGTIKRKF